MKMFLDDIRQPPDATWDLVTNAKDAIKYLDEHRDEVTEISLDHDLGLGGSERERSGYDVLKWIEEQVFTGYYEPPKIHLHTQNPVALQRMTAAVNRIEQRVNFRV